MLVLRPVSILKVSNLDLGRLSVIFLRHFSFNFKGEKNAHTFQTYIMFILSYIPCFS
jgi:hypothetical protein